MNTKRHLLMTLAVGLALSVQAQTPAFPTAEGFGRFASGGRGGRVVEVTNLNDSGEGSLRWALTDAGRENATIVFRVSGIITIGPNPQRKGENSIRAKLKNVTIAGQTAPGEGILIRGGKLNLGGSDNVIIRNIRARLGVKELVREDGETEASYTKRCFIEGGAIGMENAQNVIIDHCCFGWSGEENMTVYDNHFTTVQWCIVHEGLYDAGHKKGVRGYGCQWGGSPATFHHNLLANNDSRSARINGATNPKVDKNVFLEYQNNVNFNWGRRNSCYGGENEAGEGSSHECNFMGNYYKPGPAHPDDNVLIELSQARKGKQLTGPSLWYFAGNVMEGRKTKDNWRLISNKTGFGMEQMKQHKPLAKPEYANYLTPAESAKKAYEHVLQKAGTIHRDAVERRIIEDVKNGTPRYSGRSAHRQGIIDSPADADGWPAYADAIAPADSDHDGMSDEWEKAHGLNPSDPEDGKRVVSKEGYTALEVYLNGLMGEKVEMIR
jgi:pectate lyase